VVKTAVILAAGNGSRLRRVSGSLPKPLIRVAGVPLIERVMRTALKAGIESFVIVTGYESERIRAFVERIPDLNDRVTWVHNPDYHLPHGGSVLAAREAAPEDFALLMSDHLFEPEALSRLLRAPRRPDECLLGVDSNLAGIFDTDDATKVRLSGDRIADIGKSLEAFDAVDTGLFVCSPRLFDALAACASGGGGCSLSDGVRRLAREGRMSAVDIGQAAWQDVDTPEALRHAEGMLYRSTRKPTDGPVSRWLNRPISIQFSRAFIALGVTPNQISFLTLLLGLMAAWSISCGNYAHVAIAGLLFQLSSILDGSDGEVAKLRMTGSRKGEWIDTLVDCLTYLAFFTGVIVGHYQRTQSFAVLSVGFLSLAVTVLTASVMYFYLLNTGSGSLRKFATAFTEMASDRDRHPIYRLMNGLSFAVVRDFFSFLFCIFALFNRLDWIFAAMILGVGMLTCGVASSAGRLLRDSGVRALDEKAAMAVEEGERRYTGN
jgi:choline kinase/phosphatidylglycerophosphate synthase